MTGQPVYKNETDRLRHEVLVQLRDRLKSIELELGQLQPKVKELTDEQALVKATIHSLEQV